MLHTQVQKKMCVCVCNCVSSQGAVACGVCACIGCIHYPIRRWKQGKTFSLRLFIIKYSVWKPKKDQRYF